MDELKKDNLTFKDSDVPLNTNIFIKMAVLNIIK